MKNTVCFVEIFMLKHILAYMNVKKIYWICILMHLSVNYCLSANKMGYVSWNSVSGDTIYRLNVHTGKSDMFFEGRVFDAGSFQMEYNADDVLSSELGIIHFTAEDTLISFSGSGQVFGLSFKDSTLRKLDGTYQHGYNFDAFQFIRSDELYSFGGYGFWMENNMLTRYDRNAQEWNLITSAPFPVNVQKRNLVRQLRWYDKESDRLFAAYDRSLYAYSFEKEEWKELGVLSEDILNSADVRFERLNDSLGLIRNVETDWLVNWRSNQLHQLDLSSNNEVRKRSGIPGIQWGYVTNDVLHILRKSDKVSAGFFESFYELNRWKKWSTARLYTPILWIQIGYLLILLSFLSVLAYFFRKRFINWKRQNSNWTQFLNDVERSLVEALYNGDLHTDDVNRILSLDQLGWEVQRRKRSETIKSINTFSEKAMGYEIIQRHRSESDKRQVIYRVNSATKK